MHETYIQILSLVIIQIKKETTEYTACALMNFCEILAHHSILSVGPTCVQRMRMVYWRSVLLFPQQWHPPALANHLYVSHIALFPCQEA